MSQLISTETFWTWLLNVPNIITDAHVTSQTFSESSIHSMVTFGINTEYKFPITLNKSMVYNYSKTDYESLNEYFFDIDLMSALKVLMLRKYGFS